MLQATRASRMRTEACRSARFPNFLRRHPTIEDTASAPRHSRQPFGARAIVLRRASRSTPASKRKGGIATAIPPGDYFRSRASNARAALSAILSDRSAAATTVAAACSALIAATPARSAASSARRAGS